jgi:hypothetical protein
VIGDIEGHQGVRAVIRLGESDSVDGECVCSRPNFGHDEVIIVAYDHELILPDGVWPMDLPPILGNANVNDLCERQQGRTQLC